MKIDGVWSVLPPRAKPSGARLPASKQSEAERYDKLCVSLTPLDAGQPQEVAPPLSADVRPPCAKRAVCATLAQSASTRSCHYHSQSEAKAGRRTERSVAGAAHRSGCSRSARSPSGAEWRSRGVAAEPPYAKRCALRRLVAQCAFERSGCSSPLVCRCFCGVWFSERSLASAKMIWTPPGAGKLLSDV
jgi:hypothetical protein